MLGGDDGTGHRTGSQKDFEIKKIPLCSVPGSRRIPMSKFQLIHLQYYNTTLKEHTVC